MSNNNKVIVSVGLVNLLFIKNIVLSLTCRDRSYHLRQDGGLCFEIPPWQHLPVEMEDHVAKIKNTLGNSTTVRVTRRLSPGITNSKITQYVDTVIGPFLDTYHRNIQTSYHQLTNKIIRKTKDEINAAMHKKQKVYTDLIQLAEQLAVPEMCDEERRFARTVASRHAAEVYKCAEEARNTITKMGKYAEEMIIVTRNHMQMALDNATMMIDIKEQNRSEKDRVYLSGCLKDLSKDAVSLGYELDLSLTNARRYNEQSCEKLSMCCLRARRNTEESVATLKEYLYQCVYA